MVGKRRPQRRKWIKTWRRNRTGRLAQREKTHKVFEDQWSFASGFFVRHVYWNHTSYCVQLCFFKTVFFIVCVCVHWWKKETRDKIHGNTTSPIPSLPRHNIITKHPTDFSQQWLGDLLTMVNHALTCPGMILQVGKGCPGPGGGFNCCFIFTPKIGEDSHFDSYFSKGLKPPTRVGLTGNPKSTLQISLLSSTGCFKGRFPFWLMFFRSVETTFFLFPMLCFSQDVSRPPIWPSSVKRGENCEKAEDLRVSAAWRRWGCWGCWRWLMLNFIGFLEGMRAKNQELGGGFKYLLC